MNSLEASGESYARRLAWVIVFAAAFAWVESAVVIYLREIFFEGDFGFPLTVVRSGGRRVVHPLVKIELGREIATIVILAAAGRLAGRSPGQRFWLFLVAFGVWDIFYYVWLRVLSGWPADLMTWDLLFYVPLPWVGPVITPLLIAAVMTGYGALFAGLEERGRPAGFSLPGVLALAAGAAALIVAFCWDWKNILQVPGAADAGGVPNPFAWWLYLPALALVVAVLTRAAARALRGR